MWTKRDRFLRSMIVYAIDKARNVPTFIRADDQTFRWVGCQEKGHHTITIIMFPILKIIHIARVFSDKCHILNLAISLYCITTSRDDNEPTQYAGIIYSY